MALLNSLTKPLRTLIGSTLNIHLGTEQNDFLIGGNGDDLLFGFGGDDLILGGMGNDSYYAGSGNDLLIDGLGDDLMDGGEGIDTYISQTGIGSPAVIDLTSGIASSRDTGISTLVSIENITAGEGNDTLIGNEGSNRLLGSSGADNIQGGNGPDTYVYTSSSDSKSSAMDVITGFDFGAGADQFEFQIDVVNNTGRTTFTAGTTLTLDQALSVTLRPSRLDGGGLEIDQAQLVTITDGSIAGDYLVVDGNDIAGYQAGEDAVIKLVGALNKEGFGLGDFAVV
ncbi:MAG: calcium-binding protein [Limnobacter sp.]|nr:calcium-binding protein [Limnobacter sp.]